MSDCNLNFLKKRTIDQQADYLGSYLPDDCTFEAKNIPGTNLRKMLRAFSKSLDKFEQKVNLYSNEMAPDCAVNLLEEWERMLGIPDDCFRVEGVSLQERQRNALIKLARMNVQTVEDFKELAELFGITAIVAPGIDTSITFSSDKEARFTIVIYFAGGVTDTFPLTFPVIFGNDIQGLLECVFKKVKPANCNVLFTESFVAFDSDNFFGFQGFPNAKGFGNLEDPNDGGKFAKLI